MAESNSRNSLETVLTVEESECIPNHIYAKIKTCFEENFEYYLTWKALFESSKVNHEQKSRALAKELEDCKTVLTADQTKLTSVQTELTTLKIKYESAETELLNLQDSVGRLECEINDERRKRHDAEDERDSLIKMVERRKMEVERLDLDVKRLTAELTAAINARFEVLATADDVKSREAALNVKEQAMQHEREYYTRKIENLTRDIDKYETEITNVRKDHAIRFMTLETQLAAKTEELRIVAEKDEQLTEHNRELSLRIENLTSRLMTMREEESAMEENYHQEMQSKTKLAELYKSMVDDSNGKIEELTEAVQYLQNLVEEASKHCNEVEAKRTEEEKKHQEVLEAKNKCIAALKNELKDANILINALKQDAVEKTGEEVTPVPAFISKLIKSGLTVTAIYSQFVSMGEELASVKEENHKLNQNINAILKELEERAPLMLEQHQNYENAVDCVTSVCKQNDDLLEESRQLRAELNELKKSAGNHQREKDLLTQQVQDLSKQVCYLLKEVEEARGGVVSLDIEMSPDYVAEAHDVITSRLVTFRDVEDLQSKNKQLLTILRKLSARQEELENAQKDTDVVSLQENVECLNKELVSLRECASQHQQKLEEVVQQRDMYREMYENTREKQPAVQRDQLEKQISVKTLSGQQARSGAPVCPSVLDAKELEIRELVQRLEVTENHLEAMKTECEELKEDRRTSEQKWSDQMKAWTIQIQELTSENLKLVAEGEHQTEKCNDLKTTVASQKSKIAALEEKCTNYTKTIAKHEQAVRQLEDEARTCQTKLSRARVEVESLREENRLMRESEARMSLEKESIERGATSRALLMANLDAIKMAFDKSEAEGKLRLEQRLDEAHRECTALRKRLLEEEDHFRKLAADLEKKTESACALREKDRAIAEQATSEAFTLRRELSKAQREIEEKTVLISQLRDEAPAPSIVVEKKDDGLGVRLRESERKLAAARSTVKSLQDQLVEVKEHSRHFRAMAESLESEMQERRRNHEKEVSELNNALTVAQNSEKDLKEKLELLEDRITEMEVDGSESMMVLSQRAEQIETKLEEMRKVKEAAELERDGARVQLDEIAAQLLTETDARKLAEEKYADEVVRRSKIVEAQDELKKKLAARENDIAELSTAIRELEENAAAQQVLFDELVTRGDREGEEMKERMDEICAQNNVLHDQLQVLGAKLTLLEGMAPTSGSAPDHGSSTQLLEVIEFLRRESHLSANRVAALEGENTRLRSELEVLMKQAVEMKETLKEAERKAATETAASLRHAETLRQVEMMAVIKESNKGLRGERDALREKQQQLEQSLVQLESKLAPLEEQNSSLMSQAESARAENIALSEVNKQLRTRIKTLLERANKTSLENTKKLQNELIAEKEAHGKTREEARSVRQEKAKLEEQQNAASRRIASLESELRAAQANGQKQAEELAVLRGKVTSLELELTQQQAVQTKMAADMKKLEEVRRIARRYKNQFDEANKKNEELQKELSEKQQAEVASGSAMLSAEAQEQLREEGRREAEERLRGVQASQEEQIRGAEQRLTNQEAARNEMLVQARAEVDTLRQENEALRQREENLRSVMQKVRTRLTTLDSDKTKLEQQLKEANNTSQIHLNDSEENKKRFNVLKSQYESKLARMEKDKADALAERGERERERGERERLQRELDNMTARCTLLQRLLDKQSGKPTTSSGTEKGSTEPPPTPPTANIKPMAGPSSAATKQQIQQAATVPPWRAASETPRASIRPIQTRMAAVSPQTTSNLQSSTAVLVPLQSPTQHQIPTTQPQAQQAPQPQPPASQIQASAQQPTMVHAVALAGVAVQAPQPTAPSQQPLTAQSASDPLAVALPSGSGSVEATSSHADVMPATSSAKQLVGAAPSTSRADGAGALAQSTQDMEIEGGSGRVAVAAIGSVPQVAPSATPTLTSQTEQPTSPQVKQQQLQQATHQRSGLLQQGQQHAVAMVIPRERSEQQAVEVEVAQRQQAVPVQAQQPPTQQPAAVEAAPPVEAQQQGSSQLASSSSAVTTSGSQGGVKRPRDSEGGQDQTEPSKTVPQTKRSRRGLVANQGELFQAVESSDCGRLEVEYQVPTSSQRDQEDEVIIITSDDDEDEDEPLDEEDEEHDDDLGEEDTTDDEGMGLEDDGYAVETYDQDDPGNYDEDSSDMDEDRDVDNEVEIIDDSNEVPSQTVSSQPHRSDFNRDIGSSLRSPQQPPQQPEQPEQRSEATSSGVGNRGNHGGDPSGSLSTSRSSMVTSQGLAFLGRGRTTNQQQLLLPHGYEGDTSDDSIVPSTPTLYDPRRVDTDGFGVAVSSPQVPSAGRFTFSESNQPNTARAGAVQVGCEGIDHTRMDLSQLEEPGTERSVPTTPLHVPRQGDNVGGESVDIGESADTVAVSEAGPSHGTALPVIISVTGADQPGGDQENDETEEQEENAEEPAPETEEIPIQDVEEENGDGVSSEGQNLGQPLRPLAEEGREAEASSPQGDPHGPETVARSGQTARRISRTGFSRRGRAFGGRQKQPIVWTEPGSTGTSSRGGSSSTTSEFENVHRGSSAPTGRGMMPGQAYPQRGQRARRMGQSGFRGFPSF